MADRLVATNKRARQHYEIFDTLEAGLVLLGSEVKSLRQGRADLSGSYARIEQQQVWLYECHIAPYDHAGYAGHEPKRPRKCLLNRGEIRRLIGRVSQKGLTLVPLRIYFRRGYAKVELAVARGVTKGDKRRRITEETARREMDQEIRRHKER
jgi:SsrA-binding protein